VSQLQKRLAIQQEMRMLLQPEMFLEKLLAFLNLSHKRLGAVEDPSQRQQQSTYSS
jgi:hypothetical protein